MSNLVMEITMSLDGFVAGPNLSVSEPLGVNGELLHNWLFKDKTPQNAQLLDEINTTTGAVIVGGTTYKLGIDDGWGGQNPFSAPAFVVCHQPPAKSVEGFTYVIDGIESALRQANATAGAKAVWLMGGANLIQQYLKAGLVDEIHMHIAPILLGSGTRLFETSDGKLAELEITRVIETPAATHIRYRVVK